MEGQLLFVSSPAILHLFDDCFFHVLIQIVHFRLLVHRLLQMGQELRVLRFYSHHQCEMHLRT